MRYDDEYYGLTEETCTCPMDYGTVENLFGQLVCEKCGKERADVRPADKEAN